MNQDDNPKIYVMQLKELIYTALLIILTIALIIVLINVFATKDSSTTTSATLGTESTSESIYSYTYN